MLRHFFLLQLLLLSAIAADLEAPSITGEPDVLGGQRSRALQSALRGRHNIQRKAGSKTPSGNIQSAPGPEDGLPVAEQEGGERRKLQGGKP